MNIKTSLRLLATAAFAASTLLVSADNPGPGIITAPTLGNQESYQVRPSGSGHNNSITPPNPKPKPNPNPKPKPKPTPPSNTSLPTDTYLTVDYASTTFSSNGGTKTFEVATDAKEWDVEDLPDYCTLTAKTDRTFTIECAPNTGAERAAKFVVTSPRNSQEVNLKQASGIGAKINNMWVDFNTVRNGFNGMVIHLDVDVNGLRGHNIRANAYFEYSDGSKLMDSDNNFGTVNGQVSTGNSATADFDITNFNDFDMFIPFDQLHLSRGDYTLAFFVQIFDETTGEYLTGSNKQGFSLSSR